MHEISVTKIYGRGRTAVPSEVREKWDVGDGDRVVWLEDDERGEIVVRPSKPSKGRYQVERD